jgi:hypothetical protein
MTAIAVSLRYIGVVLDDGEISVSIRCCVYRTQPPDTVVFSPRVRPKLDRGDHLQRPEPLPSLPGYLHFGIVTGEETWPILSIGLSLHSRACQIGTRAVAVRHSRCHLPMEDHAWNTLMIGSPRLSTRPYDSSDAVQQYLLSGSKPRRQ